MKELQKRFEFKDQEDIYQMWEDGDYFKPSGDKDKKPFTIIMPPPNANGSLHIGHAVFVTLEDIMIRYHRMLQEPTLWLPGADHAGFETQVVFEKKLEKEGRNRFEIPREQLYRETLNFTLKNKDIMENQLRKLGASCDWSRERFAVDPKIVQIVYKTFKKLYDDELAYRGTRPVNWCTKHQTSLSDLEVKFNEQNDPLYYIKYGPLTLATVRPETKFGDTALAVHPNDKRYKKYVGKELEIDSLLGKIKIKVIADTHVDPKFGTGVVKITPAHDPNDFEVAQRHNLEIKEVIDKFGRMNELTGPYKGMKVSEAREKIAEDMRKKGLIEKVDDNYSHTVGKCYKCGTTIEPRVVPQWFVAVNKKGKKTGKILAQEAINAVKNNDIKFATAKFKKIYLHWMNNLRDWNISRQIVWAIQIPAWFCECGEIVVTEGDIPKECPKCKNKKMKRDSDVFDTWFSSGQWPFATLMTTKKGDFEKFYPTSVMETGWDILPFWVMRMIMLGIYVTGKIPFKDVVLHGMVRDKDRVKMSKSKGNVIDPLGIVEDFGADALRMALVFGTGTGNDIVITEEKIKGMRNFTTKIWNASRFVLMNIDETTKHMRMLNLNKDDEWILDETKRTIKKTTRYLDTFQFHQAAETIYDFFWHKFCDKAIENSKKRIYEGDRNDKKTAQWVLYKVLQDSLKMLHPFMPFVTEALWKEIGDGKPLIISQWPDL